MESSKVAREVRCLGLQPRSYALEGARDRQEGFLQLGVEPLASRAVFASSTETFG